MKKKSIYIVLTAVILCLCFLLVACDGNNALVAPEDNETNDDNGNPPSEGPAGDYYTVTFDSRGGTAVESQEIRAGNPAHAPVSPTMDNYEFAGWFKSTHVATAIS